MARTIRVSVSTKACEVLRGTKGAVNRAGLTLRNWLLVSFGAEVGTHKQPMLFGEDVVVEDDVPLLLQAAAHLSRRAPDELVEAWVLEEPQAEGLPLPARESADLLVFRDDVRDKIIELLDLAETLFEETVSDVEQRFGPYPQGKEAGASAAEIFRGLRSLLKITGAE